MWNWSDAIQKDGSLRDASFYVHWEVGGSIITLDGRFDLQDLEFLVDYIKSKSSEDKSNEVETGLLERKNINK